MLKFTGQFTASTKSKNYGVVKQIVFSFKEPTADGITLDARNVFNNYLDEFEEEEKDELGFSGCFIGYSLKPWNGEFEFTKNSKGVNILGKSDISQLIEMYGRKNTIK